MINKERWGIAFFVILALLDELIMLSFPVDFTYSRISFVPHLCFVGCMLMLNNQKTINRILYSSLCGLCYGMFFNGNFFEEMCLFTFFGYILGLFNEKFEQDNRYLFVAILIAVFLYDFFEFAIAYMMQNITMSFMKWFIYVELFTLVIHVLIVLALIYIITIFVRYSQIRDLRYEKYEKIKMKNLKRK
jgi:cell shape-determining protein MreD